MRLSPIQYVWHKSFEWTGRKRFLYLKEMEESERKDKTALEQMQFMKLKEILWHAFLNVPYYIELFKNLKITPHDIRSIGDIVHLPVLTKDIIRKNPAKFKASNISNSDLVYGSTGGSTGKPLSFYSDRELFEKMEAGFVRSLSWAGYRLRDPLAYIWGASKDLKGLGSVKQRVKSFFNNRYYIGAYRYSEGDMEKWLNLLRARKIEFIYGYASVLFNFSKYIKSKNVEAPKMKAVLTSAETLFPEARESIEEVFNCKVYDQYGSREVTFAASECEKGNMHILSDFVYLEFIKDETLGKVNPPHKVLVTSFVNLGTPFIRYDIGDYGNPKEGYCSCGRPFPMMEMNIGRMNEHIVTSDGALIYPSYFIHLLDGVKGISNFQFRQISLQQIELYLTIDESEVISKERIDNLGKRIRNEIDGSISLLTKYVDSIPPSPSGKHQFVLSDVSA